ncbi:O-antigen ligase family protein [uncultured Winogradskyella sp.]|uniref:O-antigen ligase family protein n=1 Tax=uncultured Winogradskyella sp. TaxID=395353 RepID=UPI0030D95F3C|tara:strand:+ start:101985 stop:103199 length:1215 start_codon:yes stop_codon:yes gene_type:complete
MKYIIATLLVLFASFVDIFLFRIGIIPVQPSSFLIPFFFIICFLKYSIFDILDLFKSHTFKLFASILFLTIVYSAVSSAPKDKIITEIVLSIFTLIMYVYAVQFFRTEDKKIVFLVVFLAFSVLALSVWFDYFVGLPKFTKSLENMARKGGFGENPNQASSALKFLALCVLVFLQDSKTKRALFITAMVVSVFMTFSRSGFISIILILIFGTANNWSAKFKMNPLSLFQSSFKMILVFSTIYIGLVIFAGVIKNEFPNLAQGAMGDRIDLLLGQSEGSVIAEDLGSGGGRGDLLLKFIDKFIENPLGYGTAYTSDMRYTTHNTHNQYLQYAVNLGFLALFIYVFYLAVSVNISIRNDQFYYLIFIVLLMFEGLVTHSIFYNRCMLITLAFFDSLVYRKVINTLS